MTRTSTTARHDTTDTAAQPQHADHKHPPGQLAQRARIAAEAQGAADPDGFAGRVFNWPRWTRRATAAHALATALGVPPEHVTITDDPDRTYGIHGQYPGDRMCVTDPGTGQTWEFLPDHAAHGHGWLLLGPCVCEALVPVARIATLADLGAELQHPLERRPAECDGDPAHRPGCTYRRTHHDTKE